MKYQIGDRVIVLHSNEEGEVIDIINDKMVMIEVRGVKFPAYLDQIDFPYYARFTAKKLFPSETAKPKVYIDDVPKERKQPLKDKTIDGVWMKLIPKFITDEFGDESVELFKIFLTNKTDVAYKFLYRQGYFGHTEFELKNEILPFQDFYVHDIEFAGFNDQPFFYFEFELSVPQKGKASWFEREVKWKPKQIYKSVEEMKRKNEPFISQKLFDEFPEKKEENEGLDLSLLTKSGYKVTTLQKANYQPPAPRSVVDLHIEKITDSYRGLSNLEILSIQLKEFEKWYDLAVENYQPSLIVIHGVGKGKLKEEIHELLKGRPEVKSFVNQYHPSFGYGATEILFSY